MAGCSIPEGGFSWKLWGFESHSFTVEDEDINMRLDTSGYGRYEVQLEENIITVYRDGEALLEGWFTEADYAALEAEGLTDPAYQIVEHEEEAPGALLLVSEDGDYTFFVGVGNSLSGAVFYLPSGISEEEALDRVHRIQFSRQKGG